MSRRTLKAAETELIAVYTQLDAVMVDYRKVSSQLAEMDALRASLAAAEARIEVAKLAYRELRASQSAPRPAPTAWVSGRRPAKTVSRASA